MIATLGGETMGTSWSVKLVAAPHADLRAIHHGIQQRLDAVVAQMSTWEPDSDISRFNRAAANTWHALPADFFRVLQCALDVAGKSAGAFDPSVGALVGLWGFGANARARNAPDANELHAARTRVGWQRIALKPETHEALQAGVQLDLSAIAKGFGVDAIAAHLREMLFDSALVEVGGELSGFGTKPDGTPWRVLIESAEEEHNPAGEPRVLNVVGKAVATSGDRWHAWEQNGTRHSHSIDPRSGKPVAHAAASVTVIADTAMQADAWATALTVMGAEAGLSFAQEKRLAARFVQREGKALRESMTDVFKAHLAA